MNNASIKPPQTLENFTSMINFNNTLSKNSNIEELLLEELFDFPEHKFELYEGQRFEDMVESIKSLGILLPIIVWEKEEANYIILSGHNRKKAGIKAGLLKAPVIIKKNLTPEEAVLIATETNLMQRSFTDLKHSERAYCLAEHYKAMKKQGRRSNILCEIGEFLKMDKNTNTSSAIQTKLRSDEQLGNEYGLSRDKVAKYIRLATLEKELISLLDKNEIGFLSAYNLSFIENIEFQKYIAQLYIDNKYLLNINKSKLLKQYFEEKKLSKTIIEEILKGNDDDKTIKEDIFKPVKIKNTILKKYFSKNETVEKIEKTIELALESYFKQN